MKKRSYISFLLAMVFTITLIFGSAGVQDSYAYGDDSEEENVISAPDYSFFDLDYNTDRERYSEGANKFISDSAKLIQVLQDGYFVDVDQYLISAVALNYQKIKQYLDQEKYGATFADYIQNDENAYEVSNDIMTLMQFEENFKKVFNSRLSGDLDKMLTEASKLNDVQILEAIDEYNKVISICEAILFNLPDFTPAKDKKTKAQNSIDKLIGSIDKKILSGEVHKKNLGSILYSGSVIKAGKETDSQFKTSFKATDNIYAIAYLTMGTKTMEPSPSIDSTYTGYETVTADATVYIDGEDSLNQSIPVPVNAQDYEANKGYITFELLPNINNTVGYNMDAWYNNVFSKLTSGKHEIYIILTLNDTKIAEGGFEIDWSSADAAKIKKNIDLCMKKASDNRANLRKMPKQFTVKSKSYKDAKLSDAAIKTLFTKKFKDCTKILKFVNIGDNSTSWSIEKNSLGIPKARYSTMETWVMYKAKDGWNYFTQIKLKCDYTGGGTYGNPFIIVEMESTKISPKNVK